MGYEEHISDVNRQIESDYSKFIEEETERNKWCHNHIDTLNVKVEWYCEYEDRKMCKTCALELFQEKLTDYFHTADMTIEDLVVTDVITYPCGEAETIKFSMKYDIIDGKDLLVSVDKLK